MARLFTCEDAAYTAGIIDGEGTILFKRYLVKRPNRRSYLTLTAHIDVAMTDKPVLQWLHGVWGGYLIEEKRTKRASHHKQVWRWSLAKNADLLNLLEAIIPYLKVKCQKACLMREFCHSRNGVSHRPKAQQAYSARERTIAGVGVG